MRPIPAHRVADAVSISGRFPSVHGAPVHLGKPELIGIKDIAKPDYGDAVPLRQPRIKVEVRRHGGEHVAASVEEQQMRGRRAVLWRDSPDGAPVEGRLTHVEPLAHFCGRQLHRGASKRNGLGRCCNPPGNSYTGATRSQSIRDSRIR